MIVRTRFSPSPTGLIHLGNARAALFCALYAAKQQGIFILRIEDTDATRSEDRFVDMLQEDLHWLDLDWLEGPGKDGDCGPYWQSQRKAVYHLFYQRMEEQRLIYPCFCSDHELMLARKVQLSRGEPPRYSGICKRLSQEEIAKRIAAGKTPTWRFAVPVNKTIEFVDLVKGPQTFQSDDIGDFIVRRADGTPPFLFCNAIDDATMKISHVLRGEDHLANTPRQIMLLNALEMPVPEYGHLPLIVGDDGAPLSKRHGSFAIHDMRVKGYLPLAIINYLARLGHRVESNELLNFHALANEFFVEKISRSPARFDQTQLLYWQKAAVQALTVEEFWRWVGEDIQNQVPEKMRELFAKTIIANVEFPADVEMWARIFFEEHIALTDESLQIISDAGEQFFVEAEQAVDKYGIELPSILDEMKNSLHLSGKKLFMPLRVALTGKNFGPELVQIASLLGPARMKHRLSHAFKYASKKAG